MMSNLTGALRLVSTCAGIVVTLVLFGPPPASSAEGATQQQLVDKAQLTLEAFAGDPGLKEALKDSCGARSSSADPAEAAC